MLKPCSPSAAAAQLSSEGVAWVRGALATDVDAELNAAAAERFAVVLRAVIVRSVVQQRDGLAPAPVRYAEVVERDGGRFDARHRMAEAPPDLLGADGALAALREPLRRALGGEVAVVASGLVVATSREGWAEVCDDDDGWDGFGAQSWHADGPHLFTADGEAGARDDTLPAHAINVFVPLVALGVNGATEFALGSHRRGFDRSPARAAPRCALGDAVLFDYRTWHRGLANESDADRPVLYLVVARPWWRDDRNDPTNNPASIFGEAAARAAPPARVRLDLDEVAAAPATKRPRTRSGS